MFQRLIDDFKDSTGTALRLSSLAIATAIALTITLAFLCAAAFVYVLQEYGLIHACLAGAAIFLIVAIITVAIYAAQRRRAKARMAAAAKTASHSLLADPMVVATGLQLVRAIGVKKLIPILALSGLALGLMARRANGAEDSPEE